MCLLCFGKRDKAGEAGAEQGMSVGGKRQRRPVGMVSQAQRGLRILFQVKWEPLESFSREVPGSDILLQNYSGCYMENRTEGTRVEGRRVRRLRGYSRYKTALPGGVKGRVDGL